jgi:hypothetical protein
MRGDSGSCKNCIGCLGCPTIPVLIGVVNLANVAPAWDAWTPSRGRVMIEPGLAWLHKNGREWGVGPDSDRA